MFYYDCMMYTIKLFRNTYKNPANGNFIKSLLFFTRILTFFQDNHFTEQKQVSRHNDAQK